MYKKILVIGPSGSGKSTLSRRLKSILRLPLYHLDSIWWKKDKTHISREEFDKKLDKILSKDEWIIDGDYPRTYDVRFKAADTIIYLDYPLDVCLESTRNRVGSSRSDMPYKSEEVDKDFEQYIIDTYEENRLKRYELMANCKDFKTFIIFKSREEADIFIEHLTDLFKDDKNIKKTKFTKWLDKIDNKVDRKGKLLIFLWQLLKFGVVSFTVTLIHYGLVNMLYFLMKGWDSPLPGFLSSIFSEDIMGRGHSTWGYILPFFLSNLIANTVGYILNKHKTFKSNAPKWHYIIYITVLIALITFTTWVQGIVANLMIKIGVEHIGPTLAAATAGMIQAIVIFPLQKFVLLRPEKKGD